jgi:hypothetical protein
MWQATHSHSRRYGTSPQDRVKKPLDKSAARYSGERAGARGLGPFRALIHRSAWNRNSRKSISKIVHSLTPLPLKTAAPGALHNPAPIPLVTPMYRYARSWMSFLQTNVYPSERTPHAPSQMLQVAGRGYAELLRTPYSGSSTSENFPSTHFGE